MSFVRTMATGLLLAGYPAFAVWAQEKPAGPGTTASDTKTIPVKLDSSKPAGTEPDIFARIAGSWTGGGTIALSSGTKERLRCRGHHVNGQGGKSLSLSIRCASDSYKFELASNVVSRRGQIFGHWTEASNNVSGTISGRAAGDRISATAKSDMFSAGLTIVTSGNRQTVSITPQGVFITGVHVSLNRRP